MSVEGTVLHVGDLVVIIVYFLFVLFVGLWTSRQNRGSAGGYFLAGRNMSWLPVGFSLFASNIGSLHFVGMVGSGAAGGIAIGLYELNAMYVLVMLAYLFLPVYIASGVFTMPEYLKLRLGGRRIQIYLAVLALLVYIFTKISADLYAGAIFIEQSFKLNIYIAILLLLAVAAVFTITGGLTAVIWTDFIQTIIMLVGALVLMILAFIKVGGFKSMVDKYPNAVSNHTRHSNSTCGQPREDYMHFFRDPLKSDLPWLGLVGITINSIWYWCSDQVIVQRTLAAKTFDHAKAGTILCAFIKLLPLFMLVFPGMIARILYPETVACSDPKVCKAVCGSTAGCYNIAYPSLVIDLMPAGARGFMLAVMLSALMSSLTSIFNSSSTIFAMDIWPHFRKQATELELMVVGRMFVVVLVIVSILWIPVLQEAGSELYVYIQEVSSFLQPPICCIFLLSLFWHRLTEPGAFFALVAGMSMGMTRFIVQYSYKVPLCSDSRPDPTPAFIKNVHYLYFATFLFVFTGLVAVVVSLFTKPIDMKCLQRLTFWTRHSKEQCIDINKMDSMTPQDIHDQDQSDEETQHKTLDKMVNKQDDNKCDDNYDIHIKMGVQKLVDGIELQVDQTMDIGEYSSDDENQSKTKQLTWWRRVINWICGLEHMKETKINKRKILRPEMLSIEEDKRWRISIHIATCVALASCIFLLAYFG